MSRKSKPPIALYSALADTTRCRILEILKVAPTPVHVLTEAFSISRPAISRHLRVLKSAGLVAEVKKGRENVYAFRPAKLDAARTWLETIRSSEVLADEVVEEAPATVVLGAPVAPKPARAPKKKPDASAEKPLKETAPAPAPAAPSTSQMGFDF
ncbi:metalloregulator ArsR/SmtB family transcription factor [Devosia sp.]|uniref:metalloregulator ArsR/SmtB family transcription factor n=1 Tax=Devosia sp. TaxID=1871048 RepID=UPI001B0B2B6F|nr:metalloregulator ArsR/SmtB family transcription factor [Devosia sp.]MBO9590885.1 metalloregulator ArsR/SmtB family transcription factor [Devosia sp.]